MQHVLRISFDDMDVAEASRTWVDVSSRLRSFDVDGGRDSELDEHETTKAEYLLDDRDRQLDPTNAASVRAPNVVPNRMIWHQIVDGGVTYEVFKGFVDTWGPEWDESGVGDHRARIKASDARKTLTRDAFEAADPDVLDYPDVVSADEPSFYYRLGEPAGTKLIHHARKKRKRREHERRRHYHRHGYKRWSTAVTRAEAEGVSGPAGTYKNTPTLGEAGGIKGDPSTSVRFTRASTEHAIVKAEEDDLRNANAGITLEAWVKVASDQTGYIVFITPLSGATDNIFLRYTGGSAVFLFGGAVGGASFSATSAVVSLNTWYHVVGTWRNGGTPRIYVNAVVTTGSDSGVSYTGSQTPVIYIGVANIAGLTSPIDGWQQELAIYETELSADRVTAHYNAGLLGFDAASTGRRILQALELQDPGSVDALTLSGNEITDTTRLANASGDGRPYEGLHWQGGFETGDELEWSSKDEFAAGRLTFVTASPTPRDGTYAGRFEVRNGDIVSSGNRLEVVRVPASDAANGNEWFYGWATRFPTGWVDTLTGSEFKIFLQFHDSTSIGEPNFSMRAKNGHMELGINTGVVDGAGLGTTNLRPLVLQSYALDTWHDFVLQVRWRTGTGVVRLWHKTQDAEAYDLLYENTGIPTLQVAGAGAASSNAYLKQGLYRSIAGTYTDVLYHDAMRIGRSFNEVAYGSDEPDGTTGIWPATTNNVLYGNAQNTGDWVTIGSATVTQQNSPFVFEGASSTRALVTTNGVGTGEGLRVRRTISEAGGKTYVGSIYAQRVAGQSPTLVTCFLIVSYSDATSDTGTGTTYLLNDYPTRLYALPVASNGAKTVASYRIAVQTTVSAQARTFYVGGAQIEDATTATPYVHTNSAAASRSAARVQASASGLDETQGWLAALVRPGWDYADTPATNPYVFRWRDDDNNEIRLRYETGSDAWFATRSSGGSASSASLAAAFPRSDWQLVIAAWTSTQIKVSVDGSAFTTTANTNIPTLAATTLDLGSSIGAANHLVGDIKYAAWGTGAITNADALNLFNYGPWASGLEFDSWYGSSQVSTGWNIMPGTRQMPPARYAGLSPMEIIDDAVAAEGDPAFFYVTPSGRFNFRDASHRNAPPFNVVTAKFGRGPGQLPFTAAALSEEDAFLYNIVRGSTDDGNRTFSAEDPTSYGRFGRSVLSLDTVPLGTNAEIQAYVDAMLARFKDPLTRIPSFRATSAGAGVAVLLTIDLGHLILVEIPPPGGGALISQQSYVESRKLSGNAVEKILRAEFAISPR